MKAPKYIKKMILDRAKAQTKANVLQYKIEKWFDEHGIDVEWRDTHVAIYIEEKATMQTYLQALEDYENGR